MGQPARPVRYLWVVISPTHLSQRPVPHSTPQAPATVLWWPVGCPGASSFGCSRLTRGKLQWLTLGFRGVVWRVARDAPAWGRGAGRARTSTGRGGRAPAFLPPSGGRELATWEPAPRGLAATLSWERRPRRHHEEVLFRWAPRPAWGGSASGTCACHLSAGGRSGRGHPGTKSVWWLKPRGTLYSLDSL